MRFFQQSLGVLLLLGLLVTPLVALAEDGPDQRYERGDFSGAAQGYETLLDADGPNAALYYNLGLSYSATEDWAAATLAFERSLALDPTASDARHELAASREALHTSILESSTGRSLTRGEPERFTWWRTFRTFGSDLPAILLLVGWTSLFGLLAVRRLFEHRVVRDATALGAVVSFLLAGVCGGYVIGQVATDELRPGVVMAEGAVLAESPSELASVSTPDDLYRGALVEILESRDNWVQIELVDGTSGWARREMIADIRVERWPQETSLRASRGAVSRR